MSLWLYFIVNQPVLETNLTIAGAFMVFYLSEFTDLHVSGILAVVVCGLYMTRVGKTQISSYSEKALDHIWKYLSFVANTLIFILVGVIVTIKVFEKDSHIGYSDYLKCLALYAILHLIKAFILFGIIWPLSK